MSGMIKRMGGVIVMVLVAVVGLESANAADFSHGWTLLTSADADAAVAVALKRAAKEADRPIVLHLSKENVDCSVCKTAWEHALCDGVTGCGGCIPEDSVYGDYPVKGWASDKRVLLAVVKEKTLRDSLWNSYGLSLTSYPGTVLLHVKDTADLDSPSLKADQVDVIGAFTLKAGLAFNGITVSNPPTFSDFASIISGYFPNAWWSSLEDVTALDPIPEDGTKSLMNQQFTEKAHELWYSFTGVSGKQVGFGGYYATGCTAPDRVGFELYHGTTLLKSGEGDGLTVLDHGFDWRVTADGTYVLRLYATGIHGDKNIFRLTVHQENIPEKGDITDPYFSGAVLGKWTMDMDAALAAAKANGKDVVVSVSAVTWCPYCMKMERNFVESQEFRSWAAENAYLVQVDNRRRTTPGQMDGRPYGTSLLVDDSAGGYLERNGLTLEQGQAKLTDNTTTILESLLEPVGSMADAKPICYPTLIYRRGVDGGIVGYFTNNDGAFTPPEGSAYIVVSSTLAKPGEKDLFFQLQALADDCGENGDNYGKTTDPQQLNLAESPVTERLIGGADQWDYYGFTVSTDHERWKLMVHGESDAAVKLEILAVRDDGGDGACAASAEGVLSQGVTVSMLAAEQAGKSFRLKISAPGQAVPVGYSLGWDVVENVKTEVAFKDAAVSLPQTAVSVKLPVELTGVSAVTDALAVSLELVNDQGLNVVLETPTLTWTADEREAGVTKFAELSLDNHGLAAWDDARTCTVRLSAVSGEGAVAGKNESVSVAVWSKPHFDVSQLDMTSLTESVRTVQTVPFNMGIAGELSWRAHFLEGGSRAVVKNALPEWMTVSVSRNGETDGLLTIDALPTLAGESGVFVIELLVDDGDAVILGDGLEVMFDVKKLSDVNPYGQNSRFGGYFYRDGDDGERLVAGTLSLAVDVRGTLTASGSSALGDVAPLSGVWSRCDGQTGMLSAVLTDGDTELSVFVDCLGHVAGTLKKEDDVLALSGGLAAESLALAERYAAVLMDCRGQGYAAGILRLETDGQDGWSWSAQFPDCMVGNDTVVFMAGEGDGVRAAVFGCGETAGTCFGGVFDISEHTEPLPETFFEIYPLCSPDGIPAHLESASAEKKVYADGVEMTDGTLTDFYELPFGEFYLTLMPADGTIMAAPVAMPVEEDSQGNLSGFDMLFGEVTLTCDTSTGMLTGTADVFVAADQDYAERLTAVLALERIPIEPDCCARDERPAAAGFYVLPDGRSGYAALNTLANDYYRPEPAEDVVRSTAGDARADAPQQFENSGWMLAVGTDWARLWRNAAEGMMLPGGACWLWNLGENDGTAQPSIGLPLDVQAFWDFNTAAAPWRRGWSVAAMPFDLGQLAPDSRELMNAFSPLHVVDGKLVSVVGYAPGMAFWIYMKTVPTGPVRLYYTVADAVAEPLDGESWRFSAEPAEWRQGWTWNGRVFCPVMEHLPNGVGGWFR